MKILNKIAVINWILFGFTFSPLHSVDLYGRFLSPDEIVNGLCQYIEDIQYVINKTEFTNNTYEVAWIYGHLSSLLSIENNKIKAAIDAYNRNKLLYSHTQKLHGCFQSFVKDLTLESRFFNNKLTNSKFIMQILPATGDIKSIMEIGLLLSFSIHNEKNPDQMKNLFLTIYSQRIIISDPINSLFNVLSPNNTLRNSSSDVNFISEIPKLNNCNKNSETLSETVHFINSLQRYLLSGLFAEEFYLLLRNQTLDMENLLQLETHRRQYRTISLSLTDAYSQCCVALKQKSDYKLWSITKFSRIPKMDFNLCGMILIGIFIRYDN